MDPSMVHQHICSSIDTLKNHASTFTRLQKAATAWRKCIEATALAESEFYAAVDEVGTQAHDSRFTEIGNGFNNLSDCAGALRELKGETSRSLLDNVVIPLSAGAEVGQRTIKRAELEYVRQCSQQAESIRKAEKKSDSWSRKSRKQPMRQDLQAQAHAAEDLVQREVITLQQIRHSTLNLVRMEEHKRYSNVLESVVDVVKTQCNYSNKAVPAMAAVINVCMPMCSPPPPAHNHHQQQRPQPLGLSQRRMGPPIMLPSSPPRFVSPTPSILPPTQRRAMFTFKAREEGQLSFEAGDVIQVPVETVEDWQYGTSIRTSKEGWFPGNHLVPVH